MDDPPHLRREAQAHPQVTTIHELAAALHDAGGRFVSIRERPFNFGYLVRVDMPDAVAAGRARELVGRAGCVVSGNVSPGEVQVVFTVPASAARALGAGKIELSP